MFAPDTACSIAVVPGMEERVLLASGFLGMDWLSRGVSLSPELGTLFTRANDWAGPDNSVRSVTKREVAGSGDSRKAAEVQSASCSLVRARRSRSSSIGDERTHRKTV